MSTITTSKQTQTGTIDETKPTGVDQKATKTTPDTTTQGKSETKGTPTTQTPTGTTPGAI